MRKLGTRYLFLFALALALTGQGCGFVKTASEHLPSLTGTADTSMEGIMKDYTDQPQQKMSIDTVANFDTTTTEDQYYDQKQGPIRNVANFDTMSGTAPEHPAESPNQIVPPSEQLKVAQTSQQETAPAPSSNVASDTYDGKTYYVVVAGKTGNDVCKSVGKACVGYTAKTVDVCKHFHPDAIPAYGYQGSNAAFYCNGAPQKEACSQLTNACLICTSCGVNMDCNKTIGDLEREAYVECK